MKNTKIKTSLTRKGKAITGAIATLATVTALILVPTSQAFAANGIAQLLTKVEKGGGKSKKIAMDNAINQARSHCSKAIVGEWILNLDWHTKYNSTWFSADLKYTCFPGSGISIKNQPTWKRI